MIKLDFSIHVMSSTDILKRKIEEDRTWSKAQNVFSNTGRGIVFRNGPLRRKGR